METRLVFDKHRGLFENRQESEQRGKSGIVPPQVILRALRQYKLTEETCSVRVN